MSSSIYRRVADAIRDGRGRIGLRFLDLDFANLRTQHSPAMTNSPLSRVSKSTHTHIHVTYIHEKEVRGLLLDALQRWTKTLYITYLWIGIIISSISHQASSVKKCTILAHCEFVLTWYFFFQSRPFYCLLMPVGLGLGNEFEHSAFLKGRFESARNPALETRCFPIYAG